MQERANSRTLRELYERLERLGCASAYAGSGEALLDAKLLP